MSVFKVRTEIKADDAFGIAFTASPEVRDRAWNLIEKRLGQKTCKLIRIDDTGFYISPNKAYDNLHCLHIAYLAAVIASDNDISQTWKFDSSMDKALEMPLRHNISIDKANLARLDIEKLNKIWRLVLEQYSLEEISKEVKKTEDHLLPTGEIEKLISTLETGYRKLKFGRHDFLYRFFQLDSDLNNLESLLAEAHELRKNINLKNFVVLPLGIVSINMKWHNWARTHTYTEFDADIANIRSLIEGMDTEVINSGLQNAVASLREKVSLSVPE